MDYVKKHFCSKDIVKAEDETRLITADKDESVHSKHDGYEQEFNDKSVNKSLTES